MKRITDVDANFKIDTDIEKDDIVFYNILNEPFKIYGIFHEGGKFRRMPEKVAKTVSQSVDFLHTKTAGGRVRFKTNSSYIAIKAVMENVEAAAPHHAACCTAGFDIYVRKDGKEDYRKTFRPPSWGGVKEVENGFESVIETFTNEMMEYTINFPTYSDVIDLYIGVSDRAEIEAPNPYKIEKPIVYYGSSITQGGCANRPGLTYQNFITRRFDCDYINLGFSGSCLAEKEMAEYIKTLDMKIFVYDYDHNTPNNEHLEATHERLFKIIREAQPDLPVIIMSKPNYYISGDNVIRMEIIRKTYENAVAAGDKNVYFIKGSDLMKYIENDGTVDGTHPNDIGFWSMAKVLGDVIEKILNKNLTKF